MTVKKHTPSGAQRSTSARTTNGPAEPGRPKRTAASDKKSGTKGKAESSKRKLTAEQKAQAEQFKTEAVAYAKTAYDAALAHFEANHGDPFALSRLAVVYEESKPGDLHMVVTLPGVMRDRGTSDEEMRGWIKDSELLARTLEHPKCAEAFKDAFGLIFTEHMLQGLGISWTTPEVMRVMLPLVMLEAEGTNHVCEAAHTLDILVSLSSELASDEVDREVRASLGMQ